VLLVVCASCASDIPLAGVKVAPARVPKKPSSNPFAAPGVMDGAAILTEDALPWMPDTSVGAPALPGLCTATIWTAHAVLLAEAVQA
jgi:hypothetical protein